VESGTIDLVTVPPSETAASGTQASEGS
jgi:hypothetical protein